MICWQQKHIGGEAQTDHKGSFYRKDGEAYEQAWEEVNAQYGQPFVIQQAFRERLNKWSKNWLKGVS